MRAMGAEPLPVYVPSEPPEVLPRDALGRFIEGAGYAQLWGRTARFDVVRFLSALGAYIEGRTSAGKPASLSGALLAVGMKWDTWDGLKSGETDYGLKPSELQRVRDAMAWVDLQREAYLEEALTDKQFATGGVIFALKNQASKRWRDDSYIHTTGSGAGGPSVAVTIQVAGMAQRVDVDVQRATGATVDAVSWAESMALEGDRLRSSAPSLPSWDDDADDDADPFD